MNKGRGKDTSCDADDDQQEQQEAEDDAFKLPSELPFEGSILIMPMEQRMAKLQEFQEFMERLRDKAVSNEQKHTKQFILELAENLLNMLAAARLR